MNKVRLMALIVLLVAFFALGGPVQAADIKPVELKIWSAWTPNGERRFTTTKSTLSFWCWMQPRPV